MFMYHFNEFGCKIRKLILDKNREIQQEQERKILKARKKEDQSYHKKKNIEFDDI